MSGMWPMPKTRRRKQTCRSWIRICTLPLERRCCYISETKMKKVVYLRLR